MFCILISSNFSDSGFSATLEENVTFEFSVVTFFNQSVGETLKAKLSQDFFFFSRALLRIGSYQHLPTDMPQF